MILKEAHKELEVLEKNKGRIAQRVPKFEEHMNYLGEIINLSKSYSSIKTAKVRANTALIQLWPDIESS